MVKLRWLQTSGWTDFPRSSDVYVNQLAVALFDFIAFLSIHIINPYIYHDSMPSHKPLVLQNITCQFLRYIFFLKALIVFSVLLGPAGRSSFLFFLAILHGVLTRAMKPFTGRSHFALVKWDHRFALFFLFNSIMVGRNAGGGAMWSPSWIQHGGFHQGKF